MMIEYNQGLDGSSKGEKASSRPGTKPRARASEAPSAGQVAGGAGAPSGNAEHRHGPKATTHGLKSV